VLDHFSSRSRTHHVQRPVVCHIGNSPKNIPRHFSLYGAEVILVSRMQQRREKHRAVTRYTWLHMVVSMVIDVSLRTRSLGQCPSIYSAPTSQNVALRPSKCKCTPLVASHLGLPALTTFSLITHTPSPRLVSLFKVCKSRLLYLDNSVTARFFNYITQVPIASQ